MAEIYREEIGKGVTLGIPTASVVSAVCERRGVTYPSAIAGQDVAVPYAITREDGDFDTLWTYTVEGVQYTRRDTNTVVTPLFKYPDLVAFDAKLAPITEPQAIRLERTIRSVIEILTGQTFGYEYDVITVMGNGANKIALPKRLVSADSMTAAGTYLNGTYTISNDGWTLQANAAGSWLEELEAQVNVQPPIRDPYANGTIFRDGAPYTIAGYFGYLGVPDDIVLAAMTLAGDYGCDEAAWRDRYIANIRSADWRIEFNPLTWHGTGNVIVDQLLDKYKKHNMVVI